MSKKYDFMESSQLTKVSLPNWQEDRSGRIEGASQIFG
jgi:hypothetical protein